MLSAATPQGAATFIWAERGRRCAHTANGLERGARVVLNTFWRGDGAAADGLLPPFEPPPPLFPAPFAVGADAAAAAAAAFALDRDGFVGVDLRESKSALAALEVLAREAEDVRASAAGASEVAVLERFGARDELAARASAAAFRAARDALAGGDVARALLELAPSAVARCAGCERLVLFGEQLPKPLRKIPLR